MRGRFFAALVCAVCVGAGLPARSQDYVAPLSSPALHNWLGFYGGAHVGGAWGSTKAYDSGGVTLSDYWSAAPSGVVAGVQLGYNWRTGLVIYGLEGDIGYLGLGGSATTTYVPLGYDTSTNTDLNFYLTLRGRLGVLINDWALYATGGYIGADTTVSVFGACNSSFLGCGTPSVYGSNSSFRSGWTIGGGLEAPIAPSWTAKVEYLYFDLGSTTVTTTAPIASSWTVDTDGSLVRAGLNYSFGSP